METTNFNNYSVYPGTFTPVDNEASIIKQVKNTTDSKANRPHTNVKNLTDEYKIEITAPGFTRDKIIVYADNNCLHVCAIDNCDAAERKCFQSRMRLPKDADVELSIAEYRNNMLELYIPKTKQVFKTGRTRIIVY